MPSAFLIRGMVLKVYFLSFLRLIVPSPKRPDPKNIMVTGSDTLLNSTLNNTGVAWAAVANTALKTTASNNILFFISPPSHMRLAV